ncbi:MAG: hypothetical protein AAF415_07550 [Pseudomonadota bacterium]
MRILLILAGFIVGLVPHFAAADDFAPHIKVLDQAGQTETISVGTSEAVVTLQTTGDQAGGVYQIVAVLRCCVEGETLRSNIRLRDGQGYAVILNSEDGDVRDRFTFQRAGDSILITGAVMGEPEPVAANTLSPVQRGAASTL